MPPATQRSYIKLVVAAVATAYFLFYAFNPMSWSLLDTVNLIIHEAGHTLFSPFGKVLHILGGSLLQILVPIVFASYFYFRQDIYSASLLLFWVGQNIINVSVYMGDAVRMTLPLLGDNPDSHDWHNLFTMCNLLPYTSPISATVYVLGILIIFVAALVSLYQTTTTKN